MSGSSLKHELRPALVVFTLLTLITGFLYPLLITLVAQTAFPAQANGSLLVRGDSVIGSELIGQSFKGAAWFQSRPSATSGSAYNTLPSSGSNSGPTNPDLAKSFLSRAAAVRLANPGTPEALPIDLITASASGLDPDISPASAMLQVARVARERHLDEAVVRDLVTRHIRPRQFGVLGEPRVNVLGLNLALGTVAREERIP